MCLSVWMDGWMDEIGEYDPLQGMLPVVCTLMFEEMWVPVLYGYMVRLYVLVGNCIGYFPVTSNVDFSL